MAFQRVIEITAGPSGGDGVTITENYMSFEIEKALGKKYVNKAVVKIYNLTENTMNWMGAAKNKLIVKTGYADEGGPISVFFGDVHKSRIYTDGMNKVLEIEAYDGQSIQNKNILLSYAENVKASVILDAILTKLAYPVKNKPVLTDIYQGGFSCVGNALKILDGVLAKAGYARTIQNAEIHIYKKGETVINTGLYLSPDTGLLNIEIGDEIVSVLKDEDSLPDFKGSKLKLTTLIFPQLYPGAQVTVARGDSEGPYKINSVKMEGDNFGGAYKADLEVVRL